MLKLKDDIEKFKTFDNVIAEFVDMENVRREEGCCKAVNGIMVSLMCARCKTRWDRLTAVQKAMLNISSGKITWGHCEGAKQILEKISSMAIPKMDERYCQTCEPRRKKVRAV